MEALKFFQNAQELDTHAKYLTYMAVPFNLLRCGCESWIITKDKKVKLEVFNIKFLRRINKMRCDDVKDEKIMNE